MPHIICSILHISLPFKAADIYSPIVAVNNPVFFVSADLVFLTCLPFIGMVEILDYVI